MKWNLLNSKGPRQEVSHSARASKQATVLAEARGRQLLGEVWLAWAATAGENRSLRRKALRRATPDIFDNFIFFDNF